jgi:hypothetical protein
VECFSRKKRRGAQHSIDINSHFPEREKRKCKQRVWGERFVLFSCFCFFSAFQKRAAKPQEEATATKKRRGQSEAGSAANENQPDCFGNAQSETSLFWSPTLQSRVILLILLRGIVPVATRSFSQIRLPSFFFFFFQNNE